MMYNRANLGVAEPQPSPLREAEEIGTYTPTTLESIGENISQGNTEQGITPILEGRNVRQLERVGSPLSEQEYKSSKYFRPDVKYYKGMTQKSAEALADHWDNKTTSQIITERAPTIGIGTAAFIAGAAAEPINVVAGIATMGLGDVVLATRLGKHMASMSVKGARLGAYGVEGVVGAALTEPTNRYAADMLHEDYTMADTALNIASSAVLSGGLGTISKHFADKVKLKGSVRALEEATEELDVATKQVLAGQEVDVGVVKAMRDGDLLKSLNEKRTETINANAPENLIPDSVLIAIGDTKSTPEDAYPLNNFTDDEQQALKNSGVVEEFTTDEGVVYKGVSAGILEDARAARSAQISAQPKPSISPEKVVNNVERRADNYERVAKDIEESDPIKAEEYKKKAIDLKQQAEDLRNPQVNDEKAAQLNKQNADTVQAAAVKANDPLNSTAYDKEAIAEVEDYIKKNPEENYSDDLIKYEEEIAALDEQGLLSAEDKQALEYLNTLTEEDMLKGYEAAYLCLTRG